MFQTVKHRKKGICIAVGCQRANRAKDPLCPRHRHRYNKAKRFARYTYDIWITNCRRRGIENLVTFEEFKTWCEGNGYLENKGRKTTSATIDRINSDSPYTIDNMQIMNHWDNSFKQDGDEVPF